MNYLLKNQHFANEEGVLRQGGTGLNGENPHFRGDLSLVFGNEKLDQAKKHLLPLWADKLTLKVTRVNGFANKINTANELLL